MACNNVWPPGGGVAPRERGRCLRQVVLNSHFHPETQSLAVLSETKDAAISSGLAAKPIEVAALPLIARDDSRLFHG